jgi:hypothetical protein
VSGWAFGMDSWDYMEWYNRRSGLVRVALFPILVPVMLVHGAVVMIFVFPAVLVYSAARGVRDTRRFWRRMRESGRLADWREVAPRLDLAAGTLVVEIGPKGPWRAWWIDRPRAEVDPDRTVPSWREFEERSWDVFEPESVWSERIANWTVNRLTGHRSAARVLAPPWRRHLLRLGTQTKHESVLVMPWFAPGSLSREN